MLAANFSEFRLNLKKYLDEVEESHEVLIIKRGKGKGSVLISLEEYNALMETMHLLSTPANAHHLRKSLKELAEDQTVPFPVD